MAEISPGTYFEIDGEGVEYVGVRQDPNSEKPKIITRLNPQNKDEALHREYSLDDVQERGKDFSLLGPELTRRDAEEQYNTQIDVLRKLQVMFEDEGKEKIRGVDSESYEVPSFEKIWKMMQENNEVLRPKIDQGFMKLLIVPFGASTRILADKLRKTIKQHGKESKLYSTDGEVLKPDERDPLYDFMYNHDDFHMYYYRDLSNYGIAEKKRDMLKNERSLPFPGWRVLLVEDMDEISDDREAKIRGGRGFDSFRSLMSLPEYKHESGMMLEDWLTYCLLSLEEKNTIIDSKKPAHPLTLVGQTLDEFREGGINQDISFPSVSGWDYGSNHPVIGRHKVFDANKIRTVIDINEARKVEPVNS